MKPLAFLAALILAFAVAGCQDESIPSTEQISLYIPATMLHCPGLPKSPGRGASAKQRAQYIVALYHTANRCKANVDNIRPLYERYRQRVEKVAAGV